MKTNFLARGYPETSLDNDLRRVSTVPRDDALKPPSHRNDNAGNRVPLVLTYNPFNTGTKRILLDNFDILSTDPETRRIFTEVPLVSYRRDNNLRDVLVHSSGYSHTDAGTYPCRRPRCLTCKYTTPRTNVQGPKSVYTIRDRFTCQSENVVYCIVCRRCSVLYIGETGRRLRERFSEHLRSIRNHSPGFPVAEHFNSASHSLDDITVCGLKQCSGGDTSRKQQEMRLIFEIGSLRPTGLNTNFSFI